MLTASRTILPHRFLTSTPRSNWHPLWLNLVQLSMLLHGHPALGLLLFRVSRRCALHNMFRRVFLFFLRITCPKYFIFRFFADVTVLAFSSIFPILTCWCVSLSGTLWAAVWNVSSQMRPFSFIHLLSRPSGRNRTEQLTTLEPSAALFLLHFVYRGLIIHNATKLRLTQDGQ